MSHTSGRNYPRTQCSMMSAALPFFRAKSKIAVTGVCSLVRESLMTYLILLTLYVLVTVIIFFVKSVVDNFGKTSANL